MAVLVLEASPPGIASGRRRTAVVAGARDVLPVLLALLPLGLVVGATIGESSVDHGVGWLGAALVYGASAHITAMAMLSTGASGLSVIVAVLVINSRGVIYGAGLASRMHGQPRWFRWLGPYFLVDPLYALVSGRTRPGDGVEWIRWYYLGGALTIWVMWMPTVGAGLLVGGSLPAAAQLNFALPAMLIGFLVPSLCGGKGRVAAAVGGIVGLFGTGAGGLALPVSVAAGVTAALLVEWRKR
jgi:predicted branched-subunit amino acid permease